MAGAQGLRDELGVDPPPGIASLPSARRDDLADAVRAARRRQAMELAAAGEKALALIPRVLRGPIRRMFS